MIQFRQPDWFPAFRGSARLSFFLAAGITCSVAVQADDTEIFFGQQDRQSNVLFVVDVSGSMGDSDAGAIGSRLDRVKVALRDLINTTNDINVGLLSFTGDGNQLEQVIAPITDNRAAMLASVNGLDDDGGTPTVGAMVDSAKYFRGEYSIDDTTFASPMISACQSNHIVLLTDGDPTVDASADAKKLINPDSSWRVSCTGTTPDDGACGAELAFWLANSDQAGLAGENTITTHTIGFNFSLPWLATVSAAGGGTDHTADTASELSGVFDTILEAASDTSSSFAAPAITVDQQKRHSHRSDMYLALFQPDNSQRWSGNLKRYKFDDGVRDSRGNLAVSAAGKILATSKSFWREGEEDDGASITDGGAANKLATPRNVYTYLGGADFTLSALANHLSETNEVITAGMLGVPAEERINLLQWARGLDVDNEYPDSEVRLHMGDPLHSRPKILTYGGTSAVPESVVFIGTNDGYLHAVNATDGTELYSFVPPKLLANLDDNYKNRRTINRLYGVDGDLTLWVNDAGSDGTISGDSDHAYLYMGMRRGGRNYTALNVTEKTNPKFIWSIDGGEDEHFDKLGQTWSKPTMATIAIDGTPTEVLIFGGGYHPMQDNSSIRSSDSYGNDLFIVNALTGDKLWKASDDTTGKYSRMNYSMPSDPRDIDIDGDGLTDQIYIGDMGGQIWRFDIDNSAGGATPSVNGGVIANLSGADANDNRKFFYRPDVALVSDGTKQFLSVAIGSGNRAHPLETAVADRFYMIRQHSIFSAPEGYGVKNEDDEYVPINEIDHLYNATANLVDSTEVQISAAARISLAEKKGWMIDLSGGEKVLAPSITLAGTVLFNTYIPTITANDDCSPSIGNGRSYSVSILDASPTNGTTASERYEELKGGGIPPEPVPHIDEDGNLKVMIGVEEREIPIVDITRRIYWSEQPDY